MHQAKAQVLYISCRESKNQAVKDQRYRILKQVAERMLAF
jgi:hypothetical protein